MPSELLRGLTRKDVQMTMKRIEPQESYSALISQELQQTVFGQPQAMDAVARRLALFDTGLSDPKRPLGVMMFLGPSGVGKTEASHAAAKQMFGDTHSDRLKIINMAEMSEQHDTKKFVGSPPSYVGFGEKPAIPHDWLHKGRSIIVLDEFEKAHPAVQQLFLGALDKGSMDARDGNKGVQPLNFNNTLFIITSNIGGKEMHDVNSDTGSIGFKTGEVSDAAKNKRIETIAQQGLKKALSPELLNRIDDTVIFHEITDPKIHALIFDKFIAYRNQDLAARSENPPYFAVTDEFRQHILDTVGNKGGREMKRELEKQLFNKAADVFMGMDVAGRPLVADHDPDTGQTVFYTVDMPTIPDEKKRSETEQRDRPVSIDPGSESGDTDSDGTSQQKAETQEPKEEIKPYQGDSGDENPPELRVGISIKVWDESMVDDDGNVNFSFIDIRNLPLPTR